MKHKQQGPTVGKASQEPSTSGSPDLSPPDKKRSSRSRTRYPATQVVQRKGESAPALDGVEAREHASSGTSGAGGQLPYAEAIQQAFGPYDISGVRAHVGGAAAEASGALGAEAYASGNDVAFASSPSLHTAAHEAAHVVQQQSGVKLAGGVGREGDPYEQHADRVADLVVAGKSAVGALSEMASPAASNQTAAVQLKRSKRRKGKAGGKKDKGGPKKGKIISLSTKKDGSFRAKIDRGQEHGVTPGTTCETSLVTLTVVDCGESTSWATADSGLDSVKADLKVTNFTVPKESRADKKRRKRSRLVEATPDHLEEGGAVSFTIRTKEDWMFNTYWKVELLNDDESSRMIGKVKSVDSDANRAILVFPMSRNRENFPNERMKVRLIDYFKE